MASWSFPEAKLEHLPLAAAININYLKWTGHHNSPSSEKHRVKDLNTLLQPVSQSRLGLNPSHTELGGAYYAHSRFRPSKVHHEFLRPWGQMLA